MSGFSVYHEEQIFGLGLTGWAFSGRHLFPVSHAHSSYKRREVKLFEPDHPSVRFLDQVGCVSMTGIFSFWLFYRVFFFFFLLFLFVVFIRVALLYCVACA